MYNAVAHQLGKIGRYETGNQAVSDELRQLTARMARQHPEVRLEDGILYQDGKEWERRIAEMEGTGWASEIELRLLAIGLKRDIIVLVTKASQLTGQFRKVSHLLPEFTGGMELGTSMFLSKDDVCSHWIGSTERPLIILMNGVDHYDSTISNLDS